MKRYVFLLMACLFLVPNARFGWGKQGHRIVAKIAAKNLTPEARKKVAAILGTTMAAGAAKTAPKPG